MSSHHDPQVQAGERLTPARVSICPDLLPIHSSCLHPHPDIRSPFPPPPNTSKQRLHLFKSQLLHNFLIARLSTGIFLRDHIVSVDLKPGDYRLHPSLLLQQEDHLPDKTDLQFTQASPAAKNIHVGNILQSPA